MEPSKKDLHLFFELLKNQANEKFIIKPKDYYNYIMSINMVSEYVYEKNVKIALKTLDTAFKRFFETSYKHRRYLANHIINKRNTRLNVFKIHGKECLKCGANYDLSIDHVISVKNGGSNELDNLQPLCRSCNSKKGSENKDYRNILGVSIG